MIRPAHDVKPSGQSPSTESAASPRNVLGGPLTMCSKDPLTGFFRDGRCTPGNAEHPDPGLHCVCCIMTGEFLAFSRAAGNDLSTPRPEYRFPGLKPGDHWCVCSGRWLEAYRQKRAPRVILEATHAQALQVIPLEALRECAAEDTA